EASEDQFWCIWKTKHYKLPEESSKCFWCRLINKDSHHADIIFEGVRDLQSLKEEKIQKYAEKYGWRYQQPQRFFSFEKLVNDVQKSSLESYGFIVQDEKFRRVKVTSPVYVYISQLRRDILKPL